MLFLSLSLVVLPCAFALLLLCFFFKRPRKYFWASAKHRISEIGLILFDLFSYISQTIYFIFVGIALILTSVFYVLLYFVRPLRIRLFNKLLDLYKLQYTFEIFIKKLTIATFSPVIIALILVAYILLKLVCQAERASRLQSNIGYFADCFCRRTLQLLVLLEQTIVFPILVFQIAQLGCSFLVCFLMRCPSRQEYLTALK